MVRRWQSSSARHQSVAFEDQLGIVANTAGLIVIVWWAMSFVVAVAAALLERCGKVRAASAAGKFTPAFMRRLALAAVGLQLLTAPLATASLLPAPPGTASATPAASAGWTPAPVPGGTPRHLRMRGPGRRQALRPPAGPPPRPSRIRNGGRSPRSSNPARSRGPVRHQQPAAQATEVTVRPGDSLWSLSAARLGPYASDVDIALDWPRLYQANRDIIGGNPHLLRPGQVLRVPPGPDIKDLHPETASVAGHRQLSRKRHQHRDQPQEVQNGPPNSKGSTMSAMTSPRAAADAPHSPAAPLFWSRTARHRPDPRQLPLSHRRRCDGWRTKNGRSARFRAARYRLPSRCWPVPVRHSSLPAGSTNAASRHCSTGRP